MNKTEFHLGLDYGVNFMNGSMALSELYSLSQAQSKFKDLFGWAKLKGWLDSEIMSLGNFEASWHDAFWNGENGNYSSPNPGHAINIKAPAGSFRITTCLPTAQGIYEGMGSRFSDRNGSHSYGSTGLYIDHDNWKSKFYKDKILIRSINWGIDGGFGAWSHHVKVKNFYFDGRRRTSWIPKDDIEQAGVGIWDSGEVSKIEDCYFEGFEKDGALLVRGTPAKIFNCSFFNTNRYGVASIGGGNVSLYGISGDENGLSLVGGGPGYGRPGSSCISIFGFKHETGTSGEFRPWKGSALVDFEGWLTLTVSGGTFASTWIKPYCFIRIKPTVNRSSVTVSGVQFFADASGGNVPLILLYDELTNMEYRFVDTSWNTPITGFEWVQGLGIKNNFATIPTSQRTNTPGRLQHVGPDGATSFATAGLYNPYGDPVPPPPTTCSWVTGNWSDWSTCVNGSQTRTRTVTSSVSGCVPTSAKPSETESRSCTVTSCDWITGAWSDWSICTNGTQTRTRTVTSSVSGCVPTSAKPSETESRSCTVTPPSGDLPLKPEDVVVVVNANDPNSRSIANHYKSTWGVTREIVLNLGNSHNISTTNFNTERNKTTSLNARSFALCFTVPTRVNENNSITSAFTYGYTTPTSTTTSTGFNNIGANIKRAILVNDINIINRGRSSTGSKPKGTVYTVLANDGGGTAPRGDARAPQVTGSAGDTLKNQLSPLGISFVVQDNRKGCAGECSGNYLLNKKDVLAYFGSMYKISGWDTNTLFNGAYADNLTSTSGNLPTGQGQTPITELLKLSTHSSGTVAEPWASTSTNTARQFVKIDNFCLSYFRDGKSFAESLYFSVERPWRLLSIGDPMAAPYANVVPVTPVDPPVDPPVPPPSGTVKAKYSFTSGTVNNIKSDVGPDLIQSASWFAATSMSGGVLTNEVTTMTYPMSITGVTKIVIKGYTPTNLTAGQFMYLDSNNRGVVITGNRLADNRGGGDDLSIYTGSSLINGTKIDIEINFKLPIDIVRFGAMEGAGNSWRGSMESIEIF